MAKVLMNGFTVNNVDPCPECGSTDYARINEIPTFYQICCDKCDYVVPGALMLQGNFNINRNRKAFVEATRAMFNFWNEGVAEGQNKKAKRVRIININ